MDKCCDWNGGEEVVVRSRQAAFDELNAHRDSDVAPRAGRRRVLTWTLCSLVCDYDYHDRTHQSITWYQAHLDGHKGRAPSSQRLVLFG